MVERKSARIAEGMNKILKAYGVTFVDANRTDKELFSKIFHGMPK